MKTLKNIKKELKIPRHILINKNTINDIIEREQIPKDYWTFKKQMMIDESALRIIKWQIKYYTPVPKKLKTCHFCK